MSEIFGGSEEHRTEHNNQQPEESVNKPKTAEIKKSENHSNPKEKKQEAAQDESTKSDQKAADILAQIEGEDSTQKGMPSNPENPSESNQDDNGTTKNKPNTQSSTASQTEVKTEEKKTTQPLKLSQLDEALTYFGKLFDKMLGNNSVSDLIERYLHGNDGDDSSELDKIAPAENASMDPNELLNNYKKKVESLSTDPKQVNFMARQLGEKLGSKMCATYVSEVLGLKPVIASAQQLFLQLSRQENIGGLNRTNLIKDIGQLERGDVVFFSGTYDNGRVVTHTGIIIDQGPPALMRHHPTFRKGIQDAQISPGSYYERHFYAAVKPHQKDSTDSKEGPAVT